MKQALINILILGFILLLYGIAGRMDADAAEAYHCEMLLIHTGYALGCTP